MSMSDYAIEMEEERYGDADWAEQEHLEWLEYEHQRESEENVHIEDDDIVDNLVDESLERKAEEKDSYIHWEDK